jgi:hypothetical protein
VFLPENLIAILSAVVVGTVQSSFFEWAFHRYWLHRPWMPKDCFTTHTLIHHQLCKFEDTFHVVEEEQEEALHFQWWGGPMLVAINAVPWTVAALVLRASGAVLPDILFVAVFSLTMLVYYAGYESMHYFMHKPRVDFVERSRWFQFLKRHHRIHHVHMNRNLNVLLPLADLVLGTLVTQVPAAQKTPDSARELARRHSKRPRTEVLPDEEPIRRAAGR